MLRGLVKDSLIHRGGLGYTLLICQQFEFTAASIGSREDKSIVVGQASLPGSATIRV